MTRLRKWGWMALPASVLGGIWQTATWMSALREADVHQFGETMIMASSSMFGVVAALAALVMVGEWQDYVGLGGMLAFVAAVGYANGLFEAV